MSKLFEDNLSDNQKPAAREIVAEIADDNKQLLEVICEVTRALRSHYLRTKATGSCR